MDSTSEWTAWRKPLDAAFDDAMRPLVESEGPLGLLYSGGVDSSLLAWELRGRPETVLFTLGTEGSTDLEFGRAGAERVGLPWTELLVGPEDVRAVEERYHDRFRALTTVGRSVLLSLALAIENADADHLVCGQGADELFLGYAHFRGLSGEQAELRARKDLDRLRRVDWPMTEAVAAQWGKTIVAPFLSADFERAALRIPIELRQPREAAKPLFRDWARSRGLPPELAVRPKKALQYGSGVDALLRAARREPG